MPDEFAAGEEFTILTPPQPHLLALIRMGNPQLAMKRAIAMAREVVAASLPETKSPASVAQGGEVPQLEKENLFSSLLQRGRAQNQIASAENASLAEAVVAATPSP